MNTKAIKEAGGTARELNKELFQIKLQKLDQVIGN